MTTLIPKYTQVNTANRTIAEKFAEFISVKDYGAIGDGVTDDSAAIQLAFSSGKSVYFPDGSYLMSSQVTATNNNICVDFGNATIINNDTGGWIFAFGTSGDTFQSTGLRITGGNFTQANPATTTASNFIYIKAIKDFSVKNTILNNVGNGGICVEAGAESGVIDNVTVKGKSGYSTTRGIWLEGSTASDFSSQYVDFVSITRNATAVPVYAVKNVKIINCTIVIPSYGVYLMNARNVTIDNCYIDISGAGANRCIAVNNYSPNCTITNCNLISDRSSTGVLVTQVSNNVIIANNTFTGSFAGNRAVYVQFLAEATILNNQFNCTGTQNIQIDMGGSATIKNNVFAFPAYTLGSRAVYITPIGEANIADPSYPNIGSTATTVSNLIFTDNVVTNMSIGVFVDTLNWPSSSGNYPAITYTNVKNNVFTFGATVSSGYEYPVNAETAVTSANISYLNYSFNELTSQTDRNVIRITTLATGQLKQGQIYSAAFLVDVATAGGAITVSKTAGSAFTLSVTRSGTTLVLTPRSGSGVPPPLVIDQGGTIFRYGLLRSANNYILTGITSAGTNIDFSTTAASFTVIITGLGNV